jgi:hypothetical protein
VFVRVIGTVELLFTRMLPKLTLDELGESVPSAAVPLSVIVAGEFGALLMIEIPPAGLPTAVGANFAVNVAF